MFHLFLLTMPITCSFIGRQFSLSPVLSNRQSYLIVRRLDVTGVTLMQSSYVHTYAQLTTAGLQPDVHLLNTLPLSAL